MSDLKEIKLRLDKEKIETILESLSCECIDSEQRGFLITAQLPESFDSPNSRAVQVKMNDDKTSNIRNMADFRGGDIFALVSYLRGIRGKEEIKNDLYNAKSHICKLFGWDEYLSNSHRDIIVKDYTSCLKELLKSESKTREVTPNPVLPEEILDEYYYEGNPVSIRKWIDEGIPHSVQVLYGIGFDLMSKRIVIPMRNRFGGLVGTKGRIFNDDDDERKYLYLHRYWNSLELFNLYMAVEHILEKKVVYVFEGEKSCMKAYNYGILNTVAIGASDMSDEQVRVLLNLGLDVEIILCYDKGIMIDEIQDNAEKFKGRDIYGIYDMDDLLQNKMSPIDNGLEVWNNLIENYKFKVELEDEFS